MPGLVACGRRWGFGSDDLIIAHAPLAVLHTALLFTLFHFVILPGGAGICYELYRNLEIAACWKVGTKICRVSCSFRQTCLQTVDIEFDAFLTILFLRVLQRLFLTKGNSGPV